MPLLILIWWKPLKWFREGTMEILTLLISLALSERKKKLSKLIRDMQDHKSLLSSDKLHDHTNHIITIFSYKCVKNKATSRCWKEN